MNWLSKRVLPTPALETADPALTLTYRLWADRRIEGYLPARCQLDTPQFRLVVPQVQWLDSLEGPVSEAPHLDGYGDAVSVDRGNHRYASSLSDDLIDDLRLTQFTGAPLFQVIGLSPEHEASTLQLLFLPFADDGMRVGEILVISRLAQFTLDLGSIENQPSLS